MRIAVLFSCLSGYTAACLQTLRETHDAELLVIRTPPSENAPFDDRHFDWIDRLYDRDEMSVGDMRYIVGDFSPDAILLAGWFDRGYLKVVRAARDDGVPVISGCDSQWRGLWKQQVARIAAPWYLHSAIDVLWAAGERQRQLAHRLGYTGDACWTGYYACNWPEFAQVHEEKAHEAAPAFLFVGKYSSEKGIHVLVEAYREYRRRHSAPWSLVCVGTGELQRVLDGEPGIEDRGFVQPDQLPNVLREATAFVLPSRREPWGVVLQEAAAAGMPLICSEECGAGVHLVQDGYNGYTFETTSVEHLTLCMDRLAEKNEKERATMGDRSHQLSKQYTPARWARTLVHGVERITS